MSRKDQVQAFVKDVNKQLKKSKSLGRVDLGKDIRYMDPPRLASGIMGLDIISAGGIPRGMMTQFWGPFCLDAYTHIPYSTFGPDGKRRSHKGGTIERLYQAFHRIKGAGKGRYQTAPEDSEFYIASMGDDGELWLNKVKDVIDAGLKECWRLTLDSGKTIVATPEHRFHNGEKFVQMRELQCGDRVAVHNNTRKSTALGLPRVNRATVTFMHHPYAPLSRVKDKQTGREYRYHRMHKSRATMEAHINGLSLEDFKDRCNCEDYAGLAFLTEDQHVHHIDEDCTNDAVENLLVVSSAAHSFDHASERKPLRYEAVLSTVVAIDRIPGLRRTYDVAMEGPNHNFVANGFVVHNSTAKTTTALAVAKTVQRAGGSVAFAAAEGFNKDWARKLGILIPFSDEELDEIRAEGKEGVKRADKLEEDQEEWAPFTVLQHTHGDGLLELVYMATKANVYDLLILDSLGAIKKYADVEEKSMEDDSYGGEAKLFARLCGKMYSAFSTRYDPNTNQPTQDDGWVQNSTAVIVINQARDKVGQWIPRGGATQKPTGGEALKHAWGLSIEFSPGPRHREKRGEKNFYYAQTIQAQCDKSKIGPPMREADWKFFFEDFGGFKAGDVDTAAEVAVWGLQYGVIQRKGAWCIVEGERYNGIDALVEGLRADQPLVDHMFGEIIAAAKKG